MVAQLVTVRLVGIECYKCHVLFGLTEEMNRQCLELGGDFFCPNGHSQCYTKTDLDRANEKIARLEGDLKWESNLRKDTQARAASAERSLSATRGVVTRMKNRTARGLCPVCDKTFAVLKKHMEAEHPDFESQSDVKDKSASSCPVAGGGGER